jgi:AraC-like DNA-binding protein
LGSLEGTVTRFLRTPQHVAAAQNDDFVLGLNRGRSLLTISHIGREGKLETGMALLLNNSEPGDVRGAAETSWLPISVSRRKLLALIGNAEDLLGLPIEANQPALRHLRRYIELLLGADGADDDPALLAHVGTTLADLIALALGARADAAELARMRGLRAARLQAIVAEIRTCFADPAFSPQHVARRLQLSARYVQNLLHETGPSFTARVLELRLQRARAMLADRRCDGLRINEIAYRCGFNEVSYFNRCFHRRFGMPPTQCRGERPTR